jgi:hypothetical protein
MEPGVPSPVPPDEQAALAYARAGAFAAQGRDDLAEEEYRRAVELASDWAPVWFDLGLVYKRRRDWTACARCNLCAAELDPGPEQPACWNLGIAATALRDWSTARRAWQGYGIALPDGSGPINLDFGWVPIRLGGRQRRPRRGRPGAAVRGRPRKPGACPGPVHPARVTRGRPGGLVGSSDRAASRLKEEQRRNVETWARRGIGGWPCTTETSCILPAAVINRIKAIVLALFFLYWVTVVLILMAARPVFDQVGGLPRDQLSAEVGVVLVLTALLTLLSFGIVRGWRWTFWLILIVFLAGILRVPIAALALTGKTPQQGPAWYVVLTGVVGLIQFGIALAMLAGYRKSGIWGEF